MTLRVAFSFLAAATVAAAISARPADAADLERGRYLAQIMDCGGCHTRGVFLGAPDMNLYLAGSEVGFRLPGLGVFYPPNLTPDAETGLGEWSVEEIARAIRTGERPDGRILAPAMPWISYAALTDEDALALASYLKSLPPVVWKDEPQPVGEGEKAPGPYLAVSAP